MRSLWVALLTASLLTASSCSLNLAQIRDDMSRRARSDLSCQKSELDFEELKQTLGAPNLKVSGCGRSVEYVMVESQWRLVQPLRKAEPANVLEKK